MWTASSLPGLLAGLLLALDSLLRFGLVCLRAMKPPVRAGLIRVASPGCIVLIAAKDEAGMIGETVTAVLPQLTEWPGSRLWVVADNCADATASEAAAAGACVASRKNGRLGKGAVIAWWLQNHQADWKDKDSVLVLDADSRLSAGSLAALKTAMECGADAAQAFVAPQADSSSGRLAGWSEILMQRIDDEARCGQGWQVPLRGTGMAIRAELLAELAPKLHTLAEDLELDVLLAARQAKVVFVPEAMVIDPKPELSSGAARQRARWLRGQLQVLRDYWREIGRSLLNGGLSAWFLLPLLFLRPKTLLIGLRLVIVLAIAGWQYIFSIKGSPVGQMFLPVWSAAGIGLLLDVAYYLAAVRVVDDPRKYLADLLAAPRYVVMWMYSFGVMTVRRGWLKARG